MSIRVVIADDHSVVRKGVRDLLSDEDDIAVVCEARNDSRWASQRIGVKAQRHQFGPTSVPSMIAPIVAPVDIRYDTRRRDVGAAEPIARSDQGILRMRWEYIRVRGGRSCLLTFIPPLEAPCAAAAMALRMITCEQAQAFSPSPAYPQGKDTWLL